MAIRSTPAHNSPAKTIQIAFAHAISSHETMKGIAVAKIVFFLPRYSMKGPPAIPPARPARGINPPTHEALEIETIIIES